MANLVALFANNATTTLAFGITNSATSLTLVSGTGALFPNPTSGQFFPITLTPAAGGFSPNEIVYCTARSSDVCTITRAQEGTTALAWNAGDNAQWLLTAGILRLMNQVGIGGQAFFNASGTFTVPAGVYEMFIEVWGGGGGGAGGTQAAGAGGGYASDEIAVTPGQIISFTVGAAGAGGTTGGTTTCLTLTATGGTGGGAGAGPGGVGSGGSDNREGQGGADLDGSSLGCAIGGNAPLGGFGGMINAAGTAIQATEPGGGGGANAANASFFTGGAKGWVKFTW